MEGKKDVPPDVEGKFKYVCKEEYDEGRHVVEY